MALTDNEKTALEWAALLPGALRMLGDLADSEDLHTAADVLAAWPVGTIAQELGKLRTDTATITTGTQEIGPGVQVVVEDAPE